MAITLPIAGQEISKANFGDPVANEVNRLTALATPMACILSHSVSQSIPNTAVTALTFDTELSDPSGLHSSANPTKINLTPGLWLLDGNVAWDVFNAGMRIVFFSINGSTERRGRVSGPASTVDIAQSISHVVRLSAPYAAEMYVYQTAGGPTSVVGLNTGFQGVIQFAAVRLGD